ncbi:MAG TPA: HAD family phosphatase [Albitalea sp.]|uniref:HAD family hydrolase n=1 Tax=Piscinibacter sp. TaxID=1903157 RepID=UPI002ED67DC9
MAPHRFRAAVFDMDGLLLDSERPIRDAWMRATREFGVALDAAAYLQVVGRNEADSRRMLQALLGATVGYDEVRARAAVLIAEAVGAGGYAVKAGVVALLQALHGRGVPCVVASSTNRAEVERRLAHAGLAGYFDAFSGGDEVRRGKPHPDLFLLAAQRAGQSPRDCLVFEDSEHGARGAIAAGMSVVIVPDLKTPSEEASSGCLAVLASLHEAHTHVPTWFS